MFKSACWMTICVDFDQSALSWVIWPRSILLTHVCLSKYFSGKYSLSQTDTISEEATLSTVFASLQKWDLLLQEKKFAKFTEIVSHIKYGRNSTKCWPWSDYMKHLGFLPFSLQRQSSEHCNIRGWHAFGFQSSDCWSVHFGLDYCGLVYSPCRLLSKTKQALVLITGL